MNDPHDLRRFVSAQQGHYEAALAEVEAGRKQSHWMWFVFPQYRGLGFSPTAVRFAIGSPAEAEAYLAHPVLGPRLRTITAAVLTVEGRSARQIFGWPDVLKLRSCMTLFAQFDPAGSVFEQVLNRYYDGQPDEKTLDLLARAR